jgi:hypothetical protein
MIGKIIQRYEKDLSSSVLELIRPLSPSGFPPPAGMSDHKT